MSSGYFKENEVHIDEYLNSYTCKIIWIRMSDLIVYSSACIYFQQMVLHYIIVCVGQEIDSVLVINISEVKTVVDTKW